MMRYFSHSELLIPLHSLICKKAFSTRCIISYRYLSYSRCTGRLFFGGIATFILRSTAIARITEVLYPLSAIMQTASNDSIRFSASLQSALVPSVTSTRIGLPCTSTATCIFVLSPLLCAPYPGYHLSLQCHADGL